MSLLRAARSSTLIAALIVAYGVFAAYGVLAQPVARLKSPAEGTVISDQIYIEVAFDSKSTQPVTRIVLYVDERPAFQYTLKEPRGYGQQVFKWNTRQLANGPHVLMAQVFDAAGRPCKSPPQVRVYVDNGAGGPGPDVPTPAELDEIPPTVRITSPLNGASVSGKIEIGVEATDDNGIKFVFVYIDDQFKSMTNRPPYRFVQDTTKLENGLHVISAKAVDPGENRGESAKVYVRVNNPRYTTSAAPAPPSERVPMSPRPGVTPTSPLVGSPVAPLAAEVGTPDRRPLPSPSLTRVAMLPEAADSATYAMRAARPGVPATGTRAAPAIGPPTTSVASAQVLPMTSAAVELALASGRTVGGTVRATAPTSAPSVAASSIQAPAASKVQPEASPQRTVATAMPQARPAPSAAKATRPMGRPRSALTTPSQARHDVLPAPDAFLARLPTAVASHGPRASRPGAAGTVVEPSAPAPAPTAHAGTDKATAYAALPATWAARSPARDALPPSQPRATRPDLRPIEHIVHLGGKQFKVVFDDEPLALRTKPTSKRGVAVGPIRELFEHAGGQVHWYPVEKRVWAANDDAEVELTIGDPNVKLNKQRVVLKLAPFIKNGRTMVPFGFLEKALNVTVMYEPDADRILITSNEL
ncbi:MAG: Ig-like domain-containing protein [Armatimonadota bacterium]